MEMEWKETQHDCQSHLPDPIRALFVSHDAGMYGAQRALLTLLSGIDRKIISPVLLVNYDGPMNRAAAELGIPVFVRRLVHWIPVSSVKSISKRLDHLYRFLRTLYSRCRAIERLIEDQGIDIIYTNTVTCVEGAIAAWRTRKPHVWHIHEHILGNSELTPLLPFRFYCIIMEILSRSIIFCSKSLAKDYPDLSRKAFVVYNGLPLPPLLDRVEARIGTTDSLGIGRDMKLVAVIGALHPRKDHLTFLDAAKIVTKNNEDTVFLIIGSGSESNTNIIRQRIRDFQLESRVRLLGWRNDIHELLAAVDVLVISSEQEPFGLTAIEANAMETPVVATRSGGPEEVVVDAITGSLVPVKDPVAMARAIEALLVDPVLARRLGTNGRKHVSEQFLVERYVKRIQQIMLDAVFS